MNKERHVLRERTLLLELRHFNIIRMYSTFKDAKNLYFVFEHARNGTVDELINKCKKRVGEKLARLLFAQMINCLEFLQEKKVMHRDLKL